MDTWYTSLDSMVFYVPLNYKVPHIPSMSEFITALDEWLGASGHKPTVQS